MHLPTFGQFATLGMAFFAAATLAVPIADSLEIDLVENSADMTARSEVFAAGVDLIARGALEERTSKKKKKCKRTNKKGYCLDFDSDNDKKNKKKTKQCKRTNKKGKCLDNDKYDDNKGNQKDDSNNNNGNKKNDNINNNKNNYNNDKKGYYRRQEDVASDFEDFEDFEDLE